MQELRELRLEATGAKRREASLKDAHAARIMQLEREIQKLRPAALHAKELEARLADREQRVERLRAEVPFACPSSTTLVLSRDIHILTHQECRTQSLDVML